MDPISRPAPDSVFIMIRAFLLANIDPAVK